MKTSISPYPQDVRVNQNTGHVFRAGKWLGTVEKSQNWGKDWSSRKAGADCVAYFATKTEAVRSLL